VAGGGGADFSVEVGQLAVGGGEVDFRLGGGGADVAGDV